MEFFKGFSLLEAIIAIFILSVGVLTALYMFPLAAKTVDSSKAMLSAGLLAQEKIEEISALSYDELIIGNVVEPAFAPPLQNFYRETSISYVDPLSGLLEVSQDTGLKKVEIAVFWQSSLTGGLKNVKISTIASKR